MMRLPSITENLSKGKQTWQSSIGWNGQPARAVDGNANPQWGAASCTHTNIENLAWWAVDLGAVCDVKSVSITNRADCCGKELPMVFAVRGMYSWSFMQTLQGGKSAIDILLTNWNLAQHSICIEYMGFCM
jgi:hypothetical protein